jgi:hypothetical protein
VAVFNYSLAQDIKIKKKEWGTTCADYAYSEAPFQIVCRTPVADVMELYQDRDVNWGMKDGKAVISETIHAGEIRVYEIQPKKIEMTPCTRFVNYALNKPVTVSSASTNFYLAGLKRAAVQGCEPERAVDGDLDNDKFWWSNLDEKTHRAYTLPQWLMVDLGMEKTIDHVFVLFHYWQHESLVTRLRVYKYIVEASVDGENWQKVLDESKSEKNADRWGLERWFEPVKARYVRLTVLKNPAMCGAQVVEMKVMGTEKETYMPQRKSNIPLWEAQYPRSVMDTPAAKLLYLTDLKPVKEPTVGWLPGGTKWELMNGSATLMTSLAKEGKEYPKSVYGHAKSEIVYLIPDGCKTFMAAAGLGTASAASSVIFKVYVDGKEKYTSGIYRLGNRVLPVVVDVEGGKELKLVVEDGGDGLGEDYAFWGEARLVKK